MSDPILVALIAGLVSLVVAGLSNFGSEAYKRHRDAAALAAALAGELGSYTVGLEGMVRNFTLMEQAARSGIQLQIPRVTIPGSLVYESHVSKVGLLGPGLAEEVTYVYSSIETFRSMLRAASSESDPSVQADMLAAGLASLANARGRGIPLLVQLRKAAASSFIEVLDAS